MRRRSGDLTTLHDTILDGSCGVTGSTSAGGNVENVTNGCGLREPSAPVGVLAAGLGLRALADNVGPTLTL